MIKLKRKYSNVQERMHELQCSLQKNLIENEGPEKLRNRSQLTVDEMSNIIQTVTKQKLSHTEAGTKHKVNCRLV